MEAEKTACRVKLSVAVKGAPEEILSLNWWSEKIGGQEQTHHQGIQSKEVSHLPRLETRKIEL